MDCDNHITIINFTLAAALDNDWVSAALIQQVHYWTKQIENSTDENYKARHRLHNRYWVYKTVYEWYCEFNCTVSQRTIQRKLETLRNKNILLTTQTLNQYGNKLWYAVNYQKLERVINEHYGGEVVDLTDFYNSI